MSTHCLIAIANENGSATSIYCHNDGYPSFAGAVLKLHFNTAETVKKLIDLGDVSLIDGPKTDDVLSGVYAYCRDGGESSKYNRPHVSENLQELAKHAWNNSVSYVYLFRDGVWLTFSHSGEEGPSFGFMTDVGAAK